MTTSELFRRDPPKGENGFPAQRGFTVIELMITLGVIAIITSLALPSYRTLIEKRQVTSSAQQVAAFLSLAQTESIKRNQPVAVVCAADSGCDAIMLADEEGDDDVALGTLAFSGLKATVVGVPGDGQVVFDPVRGMLAQEDIGPEPLEIQLASAGQLYALNVRMAPTGRVITCSDSSADIAVPGYAQCDAWGD